MSSINFFTEDSNYILKHKKIIRNWVNACVINENCHLNNLNIIFCSDNYLHKINLDYLNHDTLTDIITFDYSEENNIDGELFISIDRVRENSRIYKSNISNEAHRIIIHGVLHLLGYKDKNKKDKSEMTSKEDYYLAKLNI